jgi:hypothetical protein
MASSQSPPPPPPIDYARESYLLQEIITNLQKFIEEYLIFKNQQTANITGSVSPMIQGRYQDDLIYAWNEVDYAISEVINKINGPSFPQISRNEVGLTGSQLQLKYQFCKEALASAKDWYTKEKMNDKPRDLPWYKKWWGYCKKFLQGSNIVIGSISKIIPFAEAIREAIDGIVYLGDLGTDSSE